MSTKHKKGTKVLQTEEKAVREYLNGKYGAINSEWEITIGQLMDLLARYKQVRNKINEVGIFDTVNYKKNPLLSTEKDLLATISKYIQALGLTPYWQTKLGLMEQQDDYDPFKELREEESETTDNGD